MSNIDVFVTEGPAGGGWYVYEQTTRGNYECRGGPFDTPEQAHEAADRLRSES